MPSLLTPAGDIWVHLLGLYLKLDFAWRWMMAEPEPIRKIGTKIAMEWRDSKTAEVGGTERIRKLNRLLHSFRPSLDLHRARCFTKTYKEMEGCSEKRKMYFATAETIATLRS